MLQACKLAIQRGETTLLQDVSFTLSSGQLLSITGANGIGKSSLMRVLTGLAQPASGTVLWQGESLDDAFKQQACYLGHKLAISPKLSPLQNLQFYAAASSIPAQQRETLIETVLQKLNLLPHIDQQCMSLSAGQQRRVNLARLFFGEKSIWLLDEPFASLDSAGQTLLTDLLNKHLATGGMAVLTAHHAINVRPEYIVNLDLNDFAVNPKVVT